MAKYSSSRSKGQSRSVGNSAASYGSYKDRDLAGMSPEKAQEATKPTEAEPVRMQKRLAGCP
jgi:hypothetical protein